MSRNARLETSNTGQSSRYSFLETPMEMRAPIGISDSQSPPPLPVPPLHLHPTTTEQLNPNVPHEKAQEQQYLRQLQSQQQRGATPDIGPPPLEQHPAHFAPYADDIESPVQEPVQQSQQPAYQPPNSPGPIPVKTEPVVEQQPEQGHAPSVGPDSNPLQQPLQQPLSPVSPHSVLSPVGTFRNLNHGPAESDDIYANHHPGQISHPNQEVRGGTWSHGLCDCTDIGTCCLGLLCPCVLYGRTQYRLGMKSRKEDPTNLLGYEKCNGSCTCMALLCGCQWLLATIQHSRTRKAYHMKGNIASDCIRASCCTCCTLIQDEREIKKREEHRSRAVQAANAHLVSPYTVPTQMSYAPPPR